MKLAMALNERASLQVRIKDVQTRLGMNATVYEGEQPDEDPQALLEELDRLLIRYELMITVINKVNTVTVVEDGKTMTDLLAHREILQKRIESLRKLVGDPDDKKFMRFDSDKRFHTISVRDVRKKIDAEEKQLRLLNETIQVCNWTTEINEKDFPGLAA